MIFIKNITLKNDIEVDMQVASAHRNPGRVHNICKEVEESSDVVITGAGMAAHLGGVVAWHVFLASLVQPAFC